MTSSIVDDCLFSSFLDHKNKRALSVSYPISAEQRTKHDLNSKTNIGALESSLEYPCVQVYYLNRKVDQDDLVLEREGQAQILLILDHLKTVGFFETFKGIRFEMHTKQVVRRSVSSSRGGSARYFQATIEHATKEREHRNVLIMLQAAVDEYISKDHCHRYNKRKAAGATPDELEKTLKEDQEALAKICNLAALISPDMAKLNEWTETTTQSNQEINMTQRAQSTSSSSTEHDVEMPDAPVDLSKQKKAAVQGIIRETLKRFQAPIMPNSFWDPPSQNWSSLVLILHSTELRLMLRYGRVPSPDDDDDPFEKSSSLSDDFECQALRLYLDPSEAEKVKAIQLGLFLGSHLVLMGLSKPLKFYPRTLGEAFWRNPEWFGVKMDG